MISVAAVMTPLMGPQRNCDRTAKFAPWVALNAAALERGKDREVAFPKLMTKTGF